MAKVAIDPGHRKDTPGKRYADFLEYEFNDDIAKRLKKHLEHNGLPQKGRSFLYFKFK